MKKFDMFRKFWRTAHSEPSETPAERAAQYRSKPEENLTNTISTLQETKTKSLDESAADCPVGAVMLGSDQVSNQPITVDSVRKEIEELIEKRATELFDPFEAARLPFANLPGRWRHFFDQSEWSRVYELKQNFLWRFSYTELMEHGIRYPESFNQMANQLGALGIHEEETLRDEALEALIETANLAGGGPQAMRVLIACQEKIKALQQRATYWRMKNLQLLYDFNQVKAEHITRSKIDA